MTTEMDHNASLLDRLYFIVKHVDYSADILTSSELSDLCLEVIQEITQKNTAFFLAPHTPECASRSTFITGGVHFDSSTLHMMPKEYHPDCNCWKSRIEELFNEN